jgi:C_GCAxxG_C_C family probable redox protein
MAIRDLCLILDSNNQIYYQTNPAHSIDWTDSMDEKMVFDLFKEGFACSQICLSEMSDEIGLDREDAKKISALLGGGAWSGEMCGAVSGCLMALGMRYGNSKANDLKTRDHGMEITTKFKERFEAEYGSIVCRKILGYDISKPEDMKMIQEKKLFETKCSKLVCRAIEITQELL